MTFSKEEQAKAAKYVGDTYRIYEQQMLPRKGQLLEIFEAYSTFKEPKNSNWSTSFKVNKAHEIIEKILPSMTAKAPRWVVTIKNIKAFNDTPEIERLKEATMMEQGGQIADIDNYVIAEKEKKLQDHAEAIQDYLSQVFEKYNLMDKVELWAKNGLQDGKGYAQIVYKIEKAIKESRQLMPESDEYEEKSEQIITGEYPTIDTVDWTEVWYDTRIKDQGDYPALIRVKEKVRMSDLLKFKNRYINLDKVEKLGVLVLGNGQQEDMKQYQARMEEITGIQDIQQTAPVDTNSLTLKYFWGYFSSTGKAKDEDLYEIVTVEDLVVIQVKKITYIPCEEWKCFPNTKDGNAVGFVEPIMGLQDELNFKKNSASEFINKALLRQRIWSPNSGIDPSSLNDPIIQTSKDGPTAIANVPEIPFTSIGADYFNEQQDFERQIQSATHTIDVTAPRSQQGLVDTATGARIKFYESSKVLNAVRMRFERALERLGYKLLECAFENMSENIIFKKSGGEGYWYANKELMRDAINKYEIKIEVNSSSMSELEDRRDDAIAWLNLLAKIDQLLASTGGSKRIDFIPAFEDLAFSFEKKTPAKYLVSPQLMQGIPGEGGPGGMSGAMKSMPEKVTAAEELTKEVAGAI